MPRSRGSEMPLRPSPRGSHPLRSSNSDSDPSHNRPVADRSARIGDRRSPRGTQPDLQKKLGTRIADLETQLGQAQEELKFLKDQLASAEAAKKEAQQQLQKKTKKTAAQKPEESLARNEQPEDRQDKYSAPEINDSKDTVSNISGEASYDTHQETDVYEVLVEKSSLDVKVEHEDVVDQADKENSLLEMSAESLAISVLEKPSLQELAAKDDEIKILKTKLEEKETELGVFGTENGNLKNQLLEASSIISSTKAKEEEMAFRLSQLREDLEASKANAAQLKEKLEAAEGINEALEAEMKTMRVQTEQWRKAADAAATVLAGGMEMNGRIAERCGSMDKHFGGMFQPPADEYVGMAGSPGISDDIDDGFRSGKHKGSGIRMFGDFWKKKSQKQHS